MRITIASSHDFSDWLHDLPTTSLQYWHTVILYTPRWWRYLV